MFGVIGVLRELRHSQHAIEKLNAPPIEFTAGEQLVLAYDPIGQIMRYHARINELLVECAEAGVADALRSRP